MKLLPAVHAGIQQHLGRRARCGASGGVVIEISRRRGSVVEQLQLPAQQLWVARPALRLQLA